MNSVRGTMGFGDDEERTRKRKQKSGRKRGRTVDDAAAERRRVEIERRRTMQWAVGFLAEYGGEERKKAAMAADLGFSSYDLLQAEIYRLSVAVHRLRGDATRVAHDKGIGVDQKVIRIEAIRVKMVPLERRMYRLKGYLPANPSETVEIEGDSSGDEY